VGAMVGGAGVSEGRGVNVGARVAVAKGRGVTVAVPCETGLAAGVEQAARSKNTRRKNILRIT
jgi:hypothetical protein